MVIVAGCSRPDSVRRSGAKPTVEVSIRPLSVVRRAGPVKMMMLYSMTVWGGGGSPAGVAGSRWWIRSGRRRNRSGAGAASLQHDVVRHRYHQQPHLAVEARGGRPSWRTSETCFEPPSFSSSSGRMTALRKNHIPGTDEGVLSDGHCVMAVHGNPPGSNTRSAPFPAGGQAGTTAWVPRDLSTVPDGRLYLSALFCEYAHVARFEDLTCRITGAASFDQRGTPPPHVEDESCDSPVSCCLTTGFRAGHRHTMPRILRLSIFRTLPQRQRPLVR